KEKSRCIKEESAGELGPLLMISISEAIWPSLECRRVSSSSDMLLTLFCVVVVVVVIIVVVVVVVVEDGIEETFALDKREFLPFISLTFSMSFTSISILSSSSPSLLSLL